jgi:hypothetical protein
MHIVVDRRGGVTQEERGVWTWEIIYLKEGIIEKKVGRRLQTWTQAASAFHRSLSNHATPSPRHTHTSLFSSSPLSTTKVAIIVPPTFKRILTAVWTVKDFLLAEMNWQFCNKCPHFLNTFTTNRFSYQGWRGDPTSAKYTQRGDDINGEAASDAFGWSVSLSDDGNVVAIGAPYNAGNGANSGHVRVYKWG